MLAQAAKCLRATSVVLAFAGLWRDAGCNIAKLFLARQQRIHIGDCLLVEVSTSKIAKDVTANRS